MRPGPINPGSAEKLIYLSMDVHHHSHTARRKWSHYFWEFFLLFLAVFLGYLAEMRLEHTIEHQREKKFVRMMVEDLAADTSELQRIDSLRKKRESLLDSLIDALADPGAAARSARIYRLTGLTDNYESFLRNDRTIQQLKYSGAMRLIRKQPVAAEIMKYDNFIIAEVDWNNRTEAARIDRYKEIRFQLLDAQLLNRISRNDTAALNYRLLPADRVALNAVTGAVFQVKRISETCRDSGDTARKRATDLIHLIRGEYRLD